MAATTTGSVSYDNVAHDLLLRYSFRPELFFRNAVDVKPSSTTNPGTSVRFYTQTDMAAATTPLTEDVDVTAVALANSSVDVTLLEYGNSVNTTAKLAATSLFNIDAVAMNAIGFNAGLTLDTIARDVFATGANVRYALGTGTQPTNRATVNVLNTLRAVDVRRAYAELSGANVPTWDGYYHAFIHPDVVFDFQSETGEAGWRAPHVYSDPQNIYNGEMGAFGGFRFIVTPRAPAFVNAGVSSVVDVYRTIFCGREAVAYAHGSGRGYTDGPTIVDGPVVDSLRRFQPTGWKALMGWSLFRSDAMRAVESSSSIANNAS